MNDCFNMTLWHKTTVLSINSHVLEYNDKIFVIFSDDKMSAMDD